MGSANKPRPKAAPNAVVATIGSGKDHTTVAAWEQATDEDCTSGWGAGVYASPCSPVGQIEEDADFSDAVTFTGATTDATHFRRLTVAAGYRHDGSFPKNDTGAKNTKYLAVNEDHFELEWLLVEAGNSMSTFSSVDQTGGADCVFRNMIVETSSSGYKAFNFIPGNNKDTVVENCIGITRRDHGSANPFGSGYNDGVKLRNCIGYNTGATPLTDGIEYGEPTNCMCFGCGTDFKSSEGTPNYNISEDSTAPGANNKQGEDPADYFNDLTANAEDFRLKSDSTPAAGFASDLSAEFTDDIEAETRSDWDCGVDESVAGGAMSGSVGVTLSASGTVAGWGSLVGSATSTVAASGVGTGIGSLTGSASCVVAASGAAGGAGALLGTAALTVDCSGSMVLPGSISGSTAIAVAAAATVRGTGHAAATGTVVIAATGAPQGRGRLAGAIALAVTAAVTRGTTGQWRGTVRLSARFDKTRVQSEPAYQAAKSFAEETYQCLRVTT